MKWRRIIMFGALAVAAIWACLLWVASDSDQRAVERTRRALRREGFKTDLSDFDFSAPAKMRQRAAALTRGEFSRTAVGDTYGWSSLSRANQPDLMTGVARDAAL